MEKITKTNCNKDKVEVKVTFTPGYEKRFTEGILKIFEKREQGKATKIAG